MNLVRALGNGTLLFVRAWRHRRLSRSWRREWLRHLHQLGGRSAPLVVSGLAFFGAVMVSIARLQTQRFGGNLPMVGPAYLELLVREFGPISSALLAAARGAAGTSAELSSMAVTEQLEALEMTAGDPLADEVLPRVLASAVAVPVLCVLGTVAATASASLTASLFYQSDGSAFLDPRYLDVADLACGGLKAVLCGLFIPLAAARRGLASFGGAPAVGAAVTGGVVDACLGCLVIDFLVAVLFLGLGA